MSPPDGGEAATALIARYPLAWLVTRSFRASLLPLIAEFDEEGQVAVLIGHCAAANPLVADFAADPSGLALFTGPAGYMSPRYVSRSDWAPTWNFAALRVEVDVEFVPQETASSVERLLDHMEGLLPRRWSTRELGPRYDQLLSRIVAFRAYVRRLEPLFKLGQDEDPAVFGEMLEHMPDPKLAEWMAAFAEGRSP
ncbi:MAG: FMN-binding negative transcriptional regulator [Novosphingobium sp.]